MYRPDMRQDPIERLDAVGTPPGRLQNQASSEIPEMRNRSRPRPDSMILNTKGHHAANIYGWRGHPGNDPTYPHGALHWA